MPLPKILQIITARIATNAIIQLEEQLSIADLESVKPIAIIMGPVTIGGKNFIILFAENNLINNAITR